MITPVCFGPICEMSCIFLLQILKKRLDAEDHATKNKTT